ncbi:hypothetical protein TNIN_331031 [Trichonephila inaurata madagascariensis]|uniref:C3H1-type domain-containing protein n=1 Tax=Trichonephila inaurata madagascariensis TaxID=2747483 RepID=A0A8X6XXF2_9ARAC|nr:hypothetical protein TNIN_331031 [Trichonephila inaurata madagascariensis]
MSSKAQRRGSDYRRKRKRFHRTIYRKVSDTHEVDCISASAKKLCKENYLDKEVKYFNQSNGYRLINIDILLSELSKYLICPNCNTKAVLKEKTLYGLVSEFNVECYSCSTLTTLKKFLSYCFNILIFLMAMKNLEDCFFFLNDICSLGNKCQYRHCMAAKERDIVCPLWPKNLCHNPSCSFRHKKIKLPKNSFCIFETLPGGCRKHNCAFLHRKKNNFKPNPYIQSEVGEKNKPNVAVDSEELKRLHQLFKEPDLYSLAYNAPTQKAGQVFKCYEKAATSKRFMPFKKQHKMEGNPYSLNYKIKASVETLSVEKSNQGKRKLKDETEKGAKKLKVGVENKENKACVKDLQPFIDYSKVLVSHITPAIPNTVNNNTLSSNSVLLSCNLTENQFPDVSKEPLTNSAVQTNHHAHVSLPISLTSHENEMNSNKEIKQRIPMGDEFECLLD